MVQGLPRSTRPDTLFPYTTLFLSVRLMRGIRPAAEPRVAVLGAGMGHGANRAVGRHHGAPHVEVEAAVGVLAGIGEGLLELLPVRQAVASIAGMRGEGQQQRRAQ